MSNRFNFWEFIWNLLGEVIFERFVINFLLRTKVGR